MTLSRKCTPISQELNCSAGINGTAGTLGGTKVHNFQEHLQKSCEWEHLFEEPYKFWFPNLQKIVRTNSYGWGQQAGIDTTIILKCGKKVEIDEKVLQNDYKQIYLEIFSKKEVRSPGWIAKEQANQYIVYYILETHKAFLLPTEVIRGAYFYNKEKWIMKYPIINTKNETYTTQGIGIPLKEFFEEVVDFMQWKKTA